MARLAWLAAVLLLAQFAAVMPVQGHRSSPGAPFGQPSLGIGLDPWTVYPMQVPGVHGTTTASPSWTDDDLSGHYVGSANAWLVQSNSWPPLLAPDSQELAPTGMILCDLEAWDGEPQEESIVDGVAGPGLASDGLWDDGGFGGACHSGGGCGSADAFAVDAVLGGDVWIAAGCDYLTVLEPDDLLRSGAGCLVEAALGNGPLPDGVACAARLVNCLAGPCDGLPYPVACGADGVVDTLNFGVASKGVPYPPDLECPGVGSMVAAMYTWVVTTSEDVNGDLLPDEVTFESVGQPTQGYIWGLGSFPQPDPPAGPQVFMGPVEAYPYL